MSDYQKKMLRTLTRMKVLCIVGIIINLLIHPVDKLLCFDVTAGAIVMIVLWVYGLINGLGILPQNIPVMMMGFTRLIQFGFDYWRYKVNWVAVSILLGTDLVWLIYLLAHKSKYEYEKE